jgi:3-deoxy-D-manno-octulosonic-acid transferase
MNRKKRDMPENLLHKTAFGLYNFSWCFALPCLRWHHRLAEGHRQRALKDSVPGTADVWIQAASVGESFLALEIVRSLETKHPARFLLTSNTSQGIEILNRELRKQTADDNRHRPMVRYFPFDKPSLMAMAVARIRPKLMVLLETEIWPGLLRALKRHGCKILIVNGRITEKSLRRYLLWPSIWQTLRPDKILAISAADAERFGRLFGRNGVEVMANLKFDRILSPRSFHDDTIRIKAILPAGMPLVVLASVRSEEETEVKKIIHHIMNIRPETVIGLFPRHVDRVTYWQDILSQLKIKWSLRSTASDPVSAGTVIVWDTFGELMPAYRLALSAFVGGSLAPLGGQNFLEALVNGLIPIIGPSWENFAWVGHEIIDDGLLRVAGNWREVAELILEDLDNPRTRNSVIDAAARFLEAHKGGTEQACRRIEEMLEKTEHRTSNIER